jgi:cob(I)alamin adenosyltransferase
LDDTYGDGDKLNSFYGSIVKELASKGQEDVVNMLKEDLPKISKMGSQDDMSVAVVYDESKINEAALAINDYQIDLVQKDIANLQQKMESNMALIQKTHELEANIEKMKAEARMAEKELTREQQQLDSLQERLKKLETFTLNNY